jgi:hypothetical protein
MQVHRLVIKVKETLIFFLKKMLLEVKNVKLVPGKEKRVSGATKTIAVSE